MIQWNPRVGIGRKNFFLARKKFLCGSSVQRQELQTTGGTPFAAAGRGGWTTDPITNSTILQKNLVKKIFVYLC
jgi:hypothetical protein